MASNDTPLLLPPPPLTPQQTLALAVAIAVARVRSKARAKAQSAAAATAAAATATAGDGQRGRRRERKEEEEDEDEDEEEVAALSSAGARGGIGPSATATALSEGASLRLIRLTKEEARLPLARRLAFAVEAMCLLPFLPPALREECLAHARTLLLGLEQPQAGKAQQAVAAVVRGVLVHLLLPSSSSKHHPLPHANEDRDEELPLLEGACAGLDALFLRPSPPAEAKAEGGGSEQPQQPSLLTALALRAAILMGLVDGCTRALQALGRQLLLEPDAVPLRTLEGLPFLLATYERAVLARWALASASPAILAADGENAAAVVLSVLLDALVSAAQALRPLRLGEAAVWRVLARLKQRAAAAKGEEGAMECD